MSASPSNYRPDIDGLRAIAVTVVVAFHAHLTGFTGGFVGVDVFFVISGYLITKLLANELASTGSISFLGFYAKRFKRLYPALLFLLTTTILAWAVFFLGIEKETRLFVKSVQYSIFGFANFFFMNNSGGYFDGAAEEMPILHFWSLAVEEQFYFIWPLLLWLASRARFLGKDLSTRSFRTLLFISIISFSFTQYLIAKGQTQQAFYMMLPRAWELGLGGMLALYNFRLLNTAQSLVASLTGLALIIYSVVTYNELTVFPGLSALMPVIGTVLLILAGSGQTSVVQKILAHKVLVKIGLLSYGWYLWHWPMLALLRVHYMGEIPPLKWRLLACIVSLIMAEVSLRFVEKPVRYGEFFNKMKNSKLVTGTLGLSLIIAVTVIGLRKLETIIISAKDRQINELAKERSQSKVTCDGSPSSPTSCFYLAENNQSQAELFMWGDSHARAFFPMLKKFSTTEAINATLATRMSLLGLSSVDRIYLSKSTKPNEYLGLNQTILKNLTEKIKNSKKKISVLLVSRWVAYSGEKPISVKNSPIYLTPEKNLQQSQDIYLKAIQDTIALLKRIGVHKILIMLPYPEFKYHVLQCKDSTRCDTKRTTFENYRKPILQMMNSVVGDKVRLLDPVPLFCNETVCPQVIQQEDKFIPVVYDHDHPSVIAAKMMGEYFSADLKWAIE